MSLHKSRVSGAVETEKMTRPPFALGRSFVERLRLECKRRRKYTLAGNFSGKWRRCDAYYVTLLRHSSML